MGYGKTGVINTSREFFFFFNDTATTEIYTLSLHDALPIWFQWFSVKELKVPMVNYLEMGGSNGFLFRN